MDCGKLGPPIRGAREATRGLQTGKPRTFPGLSSAWSRSISAYRTHSLIKYVDGRSVAIGPGRGDVDVSHANHTQYDVIDVTEAFVVASSAIAGTTTLAIQAYAPDGGQVAAQCAISHSTGLLTVTTSVNGWLSYDATGYFNPGHRTTGGAYNAPQENIDASKFPAGWTTAGCNTTGWVTAVAAKPFGYDLKQKYTLPLNITEGVVPATVIATSPSSVFFDLGTERMAGVRLVLPAAGTGPYTSVEVNLAEELAGPWVSRWPVSPQPRTTEMCCFI